MITITPNATIKFEEVLADTPGHIVRVAIKGGGCAGFEYDFLLETDEGIEEGDQVFEAASARIVIDPVSLPYLSGATLDYEAGLMGAKFVFKNPNAKSSCGCGHSFTA